MNKKEVAKILEEIGIILELKGENPFKTRAYFNGARIIETLDQDLEKLVTSGDILKIRGIGKALSEKITTMVQTGSLSYHEDLKLSIPGGLLEILKLPGLGSKKVKAIYDELGITSVGELEYACRENRLRDLSGFGQKSQDKIFDSIAMQKKYNERFLYPFAEATADEVLTYLKGNQQIKRLEITGSLRRKMETVKDIDIIGCCDKKDRESIMQYFTVYDDTIKIVSQGTTKSAIILSTGITVEIRLVNDDEFPFLLQYNTGSKEHNTHLRRLAKEAGYKLNEYELLEGEKPVKCQDETEVYQKLGLSYIQPELREDSGEIEAARENSLPILYDGEPFHGLFHVHSTYSDGANTIEQVSAVCKSMGLSYVGICDHSKSAFYANGLTEERIEEQQKEIDWLNEQNPDFTIFKGIEVDILQDGSLDYEDNVLASFDFVIASVHSNFKLTEEVMTRRICRAIANPHVTMLGHPTGRLLLAREGYALDMEKVINTAGKEGKIIEINASPYRLDLDWRWGKLAQKRGVKTALNPDAHSVEGLKDYRYGIGIAQKGWFRKEDVLNSYTREEIYDYFNKG